MAVPLRIDLAFRQPAVRDLACLLSSPAPGKVAYEVPRSLLLGADGFERLAAWDAAPWPLLDWMASRRHVRLGHYAEHLLCFWFLHAPHIELVAANRVVRQGALTLGEFDFLLRIDGRPWHVETASKYYLQMGCALDTLVGPSLRDAWVLKLLKLERQLQLSRHPAARAVLPSDFLDRQRGALVHGCFFYPTSSLVRAPDARDPARGWLADLDQPWPQRSSGSRWLPLPRLRWLSPAIAAYPDTLSAEELRLRLRGVEAPQMVAEVVCCSGYWREVSRGFVVPSCWPDGHRLAELRERIATVMAATGTS